MKNILIKTKFGAENSKEYQMHIDLHPCECITGECHAVSLIYSTA